MYGDNIFVNHIILCVISECEKKHARLLVSGVLSVVLCQHTCRYASLLAHRPHLFVWLRATLTKCCTSPESVSIVLDADLTTEQFSCKHCVSTVHKET